MKKIIILILPLFFTSCRRTNKENASTIPIFLKEFNVTFLPDSCVCKMEVELLEKKGKLKVDLLTCDGKLNFKEIDSSGRVITEGSYTASLDTLKKYSTGKSVINDSLTIAIEKYFQPIATSNWKRF